MPSELSQPELPKQRWPSQLWLVRHGESAGNVAHDAAYAAGDLRVDIAGRDMDVALSELGVTQSRALASWFGDLPIDQRPEVVLTSTYRRAQQTGRIILEHGGLAPGAPPLICDERLREREFGILDRLTHAGIEALHPKQWEQKRTIGKFYHRPPGGESWCDVILRLRSVLDTLSLHYATRRVLIVAHEVVVLCFRYLIEDMDEAGIMAIDRQGDVVNCGVTEYLYEPDPAHGGRLALQRYNFAAAFEREGATVTSAPDANVAPR